MGLWKDKHMKQKQTNRLWGAAFCQTPSQAVMAFTAGRDVVGVPPADVALLPYDVWVNKAHAIMLGKTGIIPKIDAAKIVHSLGELEKLVQKGKFILDPSKEDVHTNIESYLTSKLGIEVAGKLHTARSRNDQVLTDMKLYVRDMVLLFVDNSIGLTQTLLQLADQQKGVPMAGFTHHQHAMVTTFGHTLAGFATMILRDIERFQEWYILHNQNPLGNVVSYGTSFPIDRKMTAALLAFDGPDYNSMDAITNRWEFEADSAFAVTIFMNHLSLIAQTLILMATPEFGMITLADSFSTGSSIMPQKKNPDPLEVMKGKAGFVQGQLVSLLSMGKSNFIGYNRDSQWTKYIIMDLLQECLPAGIVLGGVLESLTINVGVMQNWCHKGFIGATTLMEQLVITFHLPMRHAKIIVEKAVQASEGSDVVSFLALNRVLANEGLSLPITEAQVHAWQDPKTIIGLTKSYGGPGKNSMKAIFKKCKQKLSRHKVWLARKKMDRVRSVALLNTYIKIFTKETHEK